MLQHILNLEKPPKPDDAADALALAICCAYTCEFNNLKTSAK
jgi:crossover junction endodeoxyribonuclease RuvC